MKKIAIFASGNGSNFQAILDQVKLGVVDAEIGFVFVISLKQVSLSVQNQQTFLLLVLYKRL